MELTAVMNSVILVAVTMTKVDGRRKMKRKAIGKMLVTLAATALTLVMICGCGGKTNQEESSAAILNPDPISSSESAGSSEAEEQTGRKDGERFEETVMIEGTAETVKYEHVKNETIGFEIDYEQETFTRSTESDRVRFISVYDSADDPWNYLDVTYGAGSVDDVVASVMEELSKDYEVTKDSVTLEGTGSCTRIEASGVNDKTSGKLLTTYVIPAADGCRIAAAHYTLESAEGFGKRFFNMVNAMTVIERNGD